MRVCGKEGCEKKHNAKGLCRYHYHQSWRKIPGNEIREEKNNQNYVHRKFLAVLERLSFSEKTIKKLMK